MGSGTGHLSCSIQTDGRSVIYMTEAEMPLRNRLLAALPDDEVAALRPLLKPVQLTFKKVVYDIGEPIEHVFFVTRGVVSLVNEPNPGEIVEVATIGPEGLVGLSVALGVRTVQTRAIV